MIKIRKSILAALAAVAATSITACGKKNKGEVEFWSSFGKKYGELLTTMCQDMSEDDEVGVTISHTWKGSYDDIFSAMKNSYAKRKYPNIAVGYPDHFVEYQTAQILRKLDSYVDETMLADFEESYMPENYFYDRQGNKVLYGLPFNKSTELLGYNGVFIDYVVAQTGDESLRVLPKTWDEWADMTPGSKVKTYMHYFNDLIDNKRVIYATQDTDGHASGFSSTQGNGQVKVFDYTKVDKTYCRLFTWDSPDNAFITLVRQWGGKYTYLNPSEYSKAPANRRGTILFANDDNLDKTVSMLSHFIGMYGNKVFGTPADLGQKQIFSSESFSEGRVMFMVCSSGGLSYNTDNWDKRFRLAPIPYKDADKKYVISQGANICMTTNGDADKSFKVMKALTTGKYQTRFAKETGYFPASKSSLTDPSYQEFLNSNDYSNKILVTYREGARVNADEYSKKNTVNHDGTAVATGEKSDLDWIRFVDDAFVGSSVVRSCVKSFMPVVFKNVINPANVEGIKTQIINLLSRDEIANSRNLIVDTSLEY